MAKQTNEIQTSLELAKDYLQQIRQQLIQCAPSSAVQTEAGLSRVVNLLQGQVGRPWNEIEKQAGRRLLLEIRAGAARAQLLLDNAVSFHCGVALAGPAVPETYSPDGSWQTNYPNDQISLNA